MKNLETTILINASANTVWNILMDFEKYPQWNPFITHISGKSQVGNSLEVHLVLPGKAAQIFKPVVQTHIPQKEFRWLGKLFVKGLFDGEHYFQIEEVQAQQVKLIHGENFSGLLVGLIMRFIGKATQEGFESMNKAFKNLAESAESKPSL